MKITRLEKIVSKALAVGFFFVGWVYGSVKPNAPTNMPTAAAPTVQVQSPSPRAELLPFDSSASASHFDSTSITNWNARGAWCDWQRLSFPAGFRFPRGTNYLTEVTLMSQGALRLSLTNTAALAELPEPLALEPGVTSVSYGLTPSNSLLFAWQDACVNREPTNRVNASIELLESGTIVTTFGGAVWRDVPGAPSGFIGIGQDEDWIRDAFPDEAETILATGYENWLNDWVGVDEMNGRYQAAVTIAALPSNGAPCYLVCGPFRVNVTEPGTYRFPLKVFDVYETRTYPEAIPLLASYDDGYTGTEESFEMVDVTDDPPRPRLMMAFGPYVPPSTSYCLRNYMQPKVVVTPSRIPLETAVGTRVSVWCNFCDITARIYESMSRQTRLTFGLPDFADIYEASVADRVEIILRRGSRECNGEFWIYDEPHTNHTNVVVRTDAFAFNGSEWHSDLIGDDSIICLTAVTQRGSTEENQAAAAIQCLEDRSVYVAVFMATSEDGSETGMTYYDDTVGWRVLESGVPVFEGVSSAFSADAEVPHASWYDSDIYGFVFNPYFLFGQRIDPSPGESLRLRLVATAQNACDGLRETCVQIVVYPIDEDGNVIGFPAWAN